VIENLILYNRGLWDKHFEECPDIGTYPIGMRVVIKKERKDTALNRLILICSNAAEINSSNHLQLNGTITSKYTASLFCKPGTYLIGFTISQKPVKANQDNMGIIDIKMKCSDKKILHDNTLGLYKPDWQNEITCPNDMIIVGVKAQIDLDGDYSNYDYMGLVNLRFKCKKIQPPSEYTRSTFYHYGLMHLHLILLFKK
jgi:hypothetical protein